MNDEILDLILKVIHGAKYGAVRTLSKGIGAVPRNQLFYIAIFYANVTDNKKAKFLFEFSH